MSQAKAAHQSVKGDTMTVIDVKLIQTKHDTFDIDWNDDGDFVMTEHYDTAVKMSLLAERRAKSYEIALPQYRRGWIGNLLYPEGEENGSGVWLYEQRRLTTTTLNGFRDESEKGLLWMVSDNIVNRADVTVSPSNGRAMFNIKLTTNDQTVLETSFTL